jgi:hypothetical protein
MPDDAASGSPTGAAAVIADVAPNGKFIGRKNVTHNSSHLEQRHPYIEKIHRGKILKTDVSTGYLGYQQLANYLLRGKDDLDDDTCREVS